MHIIVEGDSEWKTNASWHTVAPNVNKTGTFCPSSKTARCGLTRRQLSYDCTFSLWIGATRIWPSDGLFHFCIFNIRRMYKMSQLHKDECVLAKKPVNSITLQAISGSSHTLLSTVVLPVWPFFFKALSVTWSKAAENFFFFFLRPLPTDTSQSQSTLQQRDKLHISVKRKTLNISFCFYHFKSLGKKKNQFQTFDRWAVA